MDLDFAQREISAKSQGGKRRKKPVLAGISQDFAPREMGCETTGGATLPTGTFVDFASPPHIYLRYMWGARNARTPGSWDAKSRRETTRYGRWPGWREEAWVWSGGEWT